MLDELHDKIGARLAALGKPFAVVLFNGRPLVLGSVVDDAPSILEAWFPGVEAGNAVADVLFGKVNPGGKLPVTVPRHVGQVPIYYAHKPSGGRTQWKGDYVGTSSKPLFPFGHGLTYGRFINGLALADPRQLELLVRRGDPRPRRLWDQPRAVRRNGRRAVHPLPCQSRADRPASG